MSRRSSFTFKYSFHRTGRTSLGTWGLPRVVDRWLVFFLSRGDHEDDRPLLLARPRKLARVDLPDDHAEAVQREKDVVELAAAEVTPKNKAYALTQDEAGRVHRLYTSAMNAASPADARPMNTWSRVERFSVENHLLIVERSRVRAFQSLNGESLRVECWGFRARELGFRI